MITVIEHLVGNLRNVATYNSNAQIAPSSNPVDRQGATMEKGIATTSIRLAGATHCR